MTFSVAGTPLSQVSKIGYSTYQHAANFPGGDASLQLQVDLNGGTLADGGFTTLVYEPYLQGGDNGGVVADQWQHWDASISASSGRAAPPASLTAGGGRSAPATRSRRSSPGNPNAIVARDRRQRRLRSTLGYDVGVDGIEFNDTTWNFEIPAAHAVHQGRLQERRLGEAQRNVFKNQGDCVSWVATGGK